MRVFQYYPVSIIIHHPIPHKNGKMGILPTLLTRSDWSTPGRAQPAGKLYVLLLNGDAFRMDGAEIRIVEEVHEEGFSGLLQRHDGLTLPSTGTIFGGYRLRNFSNLGKL